jgi:hypothetical protein
MVDPEAIARDWAKRHPEFIRPDADILKEVKTMKEVTTKRYICQYCNKTFSYRLVWLKHKNKHVKMDTIKPIVKEDATPLQPVVCSPTVADAVYAPTETTSNTTIQHPATDPIYYLITAILSTLLLCGLIAAALGIKLLAGL